MPDNTKLSKLLSYVLRHKPDAIGITLDENGWVEVDTLLNKLAAHGEEVSLDVLKHTVATNGKQRFGFNADASKIRANQGHSVEVDLGYEEKQPPAVLFHGTVERFLPDIMTTGLQKMDRHHAHLSADISTATQVGKRRGKPVILVVDANQMHADGLVFYLSNNGVWLTDNVPPKYIAQQV